MQVGITCKFAEKSLYSLGGKANKRGGGNDHGPFSRKKGRKVCSETVLQSFRQIEGGKEGNVVGKKIPCLKGRLETGSTKRGREVHALERRALDKKRKKGETATRKTGTAYLRLPFKSPLQMWGKTLSK